MDGRACRCSGTGSRSWRESADCVAVAEVHSQGAVRGVDTRMATGGMLVHLHPYQFRLNRPMCSSLDEELERHDASSASKALSAEEIRRFQKSAL